MGLPSIQGMGEGAGALWFLLATAVGPWQHRRGHHISDPERFPRHPAAPEGCEHERKPTQEATK